MSKPKVRFKGYTDAWEQRKLGEVIKVHQFKPYIAEPNNDGKYEVIQQGNDAVIGYADGEPFANYKSIVLFGDHTVSIYKPINPFFIATDGIKILDTIDNFDGYFFYSLLEKYKPQSEGYKRHFSILKEQECFYTSSKDEQQCIGYYFATLDNLITLHQRKCDETKTLKKYMLQKMFPQDGDCVPEIRFSGFTDAWEQRKVLDVAPLQRGFDLPASEMQDGIYPVVMSNGIGGYHSEYKVKGPGVITGRSGTIGKLHYIEDDYWPHNTSLWVTSFKNNAPKFVYYMYQKLDLSRFGSGSGVPTLNRNDVHDEMVSIPLLEEQQKIAGYFTALDSLITLHQRKCEELQNIKKFMLQNMFV